MARKIWLNNQHRRWLGRLCGLSGLVPERLGLLRGGNPEPNTPAREDRTKNPPETCCLKMAHGLQKGRGGLGLYRLRWGNIEGTLAASLMIMSCLIGCLHLVCLVSLRCVCVCVHVFVFMSVLFSQVIWLPACSAPNSGVPNGAPTASHA